jgi:hypothetical protein
MTKTTKTHPTKKAKSEKFLLVFLLDRTGSMQACYDSTVSGFNEFLKEQKAEKSGQADLTLVKFDSHADEPMCQIAYSARPITEVAPLGSDENPYSPRGMTPLYDAVGQTIKATESVAINYDHVLFIIQTDGQENSSREYNQRTVFDLVGKKREEGWDFIFLGADIDAYDASQTLNVPVANTVSYDAWSQSGLAFASLSRATSMYRSTSGGTSGAVDALAGAPVARPNGSGVLKGKKPKVAGL